MKANYRMPFFLFIEYMSFWFWFLNVFISVRPVLHQRYFQVIWTTKGQTVVWELSWFDCVGPRSDVIWCQPSDITTRLRLRSCACHELMYMFCLPLSPSNKCFLFWFIWTNTALCTSSDWLSIHPSFHLSIYPYFYPFNYPIWLWYSQIGASGQLASRGSECYEYLMVIQATNSLANVAKKRNKVTLSYLSLKGKSNKKTSLQYYVLCAPNSL